jgi:ribosomal protein L37AE/L43A
MTDIINFPKFRTKSDPTPNDYLVVCPKCLEARWTIRIQGIIFYCEKCNARLREATRREYGRARLALLKEYVFRKGNK